MITDASPPAAASVASLPVPELPAPPMLLESIGDAFFALDTAWRFAYVNARAEEVLQRTRGELLGRVVWDAFPDAVGTTFEREYERAVRDRTMVAFETHYARLDAWFAVRAHPVADGLLVFFQDVTATHRAAAALRESEERFRVVQEASPDGVMVFRAVRGAVRDAVDGATDGAAPTPAAPVVDFEWLYANPAAAAVIGRAADGLVGKRLLVELPGNRDTGLFDAYVRVLETGEPWTREFAYRHDGLDASFRTVAVRVGDGIAVTFSDETARHRAEAAARVWSDVAAHSATGVAVSDAATRRIQLCNPAFAAMHGTTAAALVGSHVLDTYAPDRHEEVLRASDVADAAGHAGFETVQLRADGSRFPAYVDITTLRDPDGSIRYRVTSVQDVTERKRAEDALRFLAEVGQAVAVASLDVGTMLDGVARLAVPRVADFCVIDLVRDGRLRRIAFAAADPVRAAMRDAVLADAPSLDDDTPTATVVRAGEPLLEVDATRARGEVARALEARSLLAVPLRAAGRTLGAVLVGYAESGRRYAPRDVALAEELARRVAVAVESARLHTEAVQARADAEEAARWAELLADASSALAAGAEYALPHVARLAVPLLGDVCLIDVAEEGGRFQRAGVAYAGAAGERRLAGWRTWTPAGDGPLARVLREGRPAMVRTVTDEWLQSLAHDDAHLDALRGAGLVSLLIVPLVVPRDRAAFPGGRLADESGAAVGAPRVLGLLTLAVLGRRRPYHGGNLARADELARRIAVAMDRARLHREALAARAEAEEASRAKSQFLATMSHELRTPLNAILGYTELLDLGVAGPLTDAQRGYHERVRASGKHLLGLINDVLDFAKVEAGQLAVVPRSAAAGDVAAEAMELVRPQAAARGLALALACEPPGTAFCGDPDRVRQILVNLLSNAVKFTDAGGRVEVTCGAADAAPLAVEPPRAAQPPASPAWAYLRVRDTGVGIAADKLEAIFEPFVQVDGARTRYTRTQGGTGLGLAISRQFARLMHGDLTVESTPGAGSTFTLWLPAAPPTDASRHTVGPALALGRLLAAHAGEVVADLVARLRDAPDVPYAHAASQADLEDHVGAFLADLAQHLTILDDAHADDRLELLRDGAELQHLLAARHGAQRRRLGWDEAAVRREYGLLADVVEDALRRHAPPAASGTTSRDAGALDDAVALLRALLAQSADAAMVGYRGTGGVNG